MMEKTTVTLDAKLLKEALKKHPKESRAAVVEEGLRALLAREAQLNILMFAERQKKLRESKAAGLKRRRS